MRTNEAGLALIKSFEELRLEAYVCPAGKLTIGYGHTGNVVPGMRITAETAEELLEEDLQAAETFVNRHVAEPLERTGRSLTANQFSALVAFTFNAGTGSLLCSTLLKRLLAGDVAGAALEFPRWNKAHRPDGTLVELAGLTRRRAAEQALFLAA